MGRDRIRRDRYAPAWRRRLRPKPKFLCGTCKKRRAFREGTKACRVCREAAQVARWREQDRRQAAKEREQKKALRKKISEYIRAYDKAAKFARQAFIRTLEHLWE